MHSWLVSGIQDAPKTVAAAVYRGRVFAHLVLDQLHYKFGGLTYSGCPTPTVVPGTIDRTLVKQLLWCPLPTRLIMEKDSP